MPWNGSGTYSRTDGTRSGSTTWAQAKAAAVKIIAADHDTHDQDLATAINNCMTKDGQNAATADLDMGSNKLTALADGTTSGDALHYGQIGSEVQAYGSTLTDFSALAVTDGNIPVGNGTTWVAESGATARTSLGLGTAALLTAPTVTDNTITRFDGTDGTVQGTSWTVDDSDVMLAADNILQRAVIKDYGETVNAIGAIGGGTQDIDLESGNVVSATVDTAETTFTFSNPPASGTAGSFTLFLTNGGSQTVNWPASVDWAGGTAPTLTSSGVDILTFVTIDGGTTWYGFTSGLDMQ